MKSITKLAEHKLICTVALLAALAAATGCHSSKEPSHYTYYTAPQGGAYTTEPSTTAKSESHIITAAPGTTNMVVPLYQESIAVGKREVDAGSVRLRKIVKTETVNQPVELRREEVVIERVPPGAPASQNQGQSLGQPFEQQETVIMLKREEAVVEKQTAPAGQIVVQSRFRGQQTNIQAQVRREDIDIQKVGNPQNVIIGQNVQSSTQATGAAESPGGEATGTASSATITQPGMLASSEPSALIGRQVQLSGLKVQNIFDNRVIALSSDGGRTFYAVSKEPVANINVGDMVTLSGKINKLSEAQISIMGEQAAQRVRSQPYYIDADKLQAMEK